MPLWGVANTGPWMHDGRATSLTDAILLHGGDSAYTRDNFQRLSDSDQDNVIEFLQSLRIVASDLRYIVTTLPLPGREDGSRSFGSEKEGASKSSSSFGSDDASASLDSNGDSYEAIVAGLEAEGAISSE